MLKRTLFAALVVALCADDGAAQDVVDAADYVLATDAPDAVVPVSWLHDAVLGEGRFRPHWIGGTEVTFLSVEARTGGRITLSFDDSDTAGTDLSLLGGEALDDTAIAPRLWVGSQLTRHIGVVGRYWSLSRNDTFIPAPIPGTVELTNFATRLEAERMEAYTIDVEGVVSASPGLWKLDGSVGARHASFGVDSSITSFGVFTSGNFHNLLLANGSSFDGTGVTFGMTARRELFNSHTHLFVSGRGSSLSGHSDSFGRSAGAVASSPDAPLVGAATVTRNNAESDMTITELQIGLEWDYSLRCLPATFFFRSAYEYQYWDIDGPPTGGAGFGGTIGDLTTNSFASAGLGGLKLHGVSLATGLTW